MAVDDRERDAKPNVAPVERDRGNNAPLAETDEDEQLLLTGGLALLPILLRRPRKNAWI